ncbi:type VII secretion integral membrane protein EccD [Mycobacterium asiaticum]|uniref:Type VII secretion integral membrane protein EccD n=1 Tax=Mycobacterium asiaticum TaxID=1790 RepID=A0A1A3CX10_MYCAS|nr:type VII secretion integral membrane protein EccD [Mycobacterium asiaticum]OBI91345.1 type VII secretion integral membrane protein EccD [Mycobacterium asiaticum]
MDPVSASEMRCVAVHTGSGEVDLVLPADVPVAVLIPAIVDLLGGADPVPDRHLLCTLGGSPLLGVTTLAQNGIEDGATLVLHREAPRPPTRPRADESEAVLAGLGDPPQARRPSPVVTALGAVVITAAGLLVLIRNTFSTNQSDLTAAGMTGAAAVAALCLASVAQRSYRQPAAALTLSIIAAMFAGVTGLLAVPGTPAGPHVLLATMAVAVSAVVSMRLTSCGVTALTALACCALIGAAAAMAGVLTAAPPHVVGAVTALSCLGLIEVAPRLSMRLAGLSPALPDERELADDAACADRWLTSLRAAFAIGAGSGAALAALTSPRAGLLAALTAALLLLHARLDHRRMLMFTCTGIATTAVVLAVVAGHLPQRGSWIAAVTTVSAAAAMYLGFVAPSISLSPVARRGVDALGCVTLAAAVPVACWTCGAFGAVRGLNLLSA